MSKRSTDKRHIAIYVRVSTVEQETESQEPDLKRWQRAYAACLPVKWYRDKDSGEKKDRPAWKRLEADIRMGKVRAIVVWSIDRLDRSASMLTALFDDLQKRKIPLVSMTEGFDLMTPAGELVATVIAAVAQFETKRRRERQRAGIAVAKKAGKYKGRKPGTTKENPRAALRLKQKGLNNTEIAQALGVSRMTVIRYLKQAS